jgi:hypothetical protein
MVHPFRRRSSDIPRATDSRAASRRRDDRIAAVTLSRILWNIEWVTARAQKEATTAISFRSVSENSFSSFA